jgi:hypothetical protein
MELRVIHLWQGVAWYGSARHGEALHGVPRRGSARRGLAWQGLFRFIHYGEAGQCRAGLGPAWQREAWHGFLFEGFR